MSLKVQIFYKPASVFSFSGFNNFIWRPLDSTMFSVFNSDRRRITVSVAVPIKLLSSSRVILIFSVLSFRYRNLLPKVRGFQLTVLLRIFEQCHVYSDWNHPVLYRLSESCHEQNWNCFYQMHQKCVRDVVKYAVRVCFG